MSAVDDAQWGESGKDCAARPQQWLQVLNTPREMTQRRIHRHGRQHRAPRLSPRRDSADQQGRARTKGRNV